MGKFSRRDFLRASAIGIAFAPAVASAQYDSFFPFDSEKDSFNNKHLGAFWQGVASGDPLTDAVILWTRVTPLSEGEQEVKVGWEVATDSEFYNVIRRSHSIVNNETDYTIKVDVKNLDPDTTYYYRFITDSNKSTIGVTKTLPEYTSKVKLAVLSCSNYPAGYFNVYLEAARQQGELDAVIHLGDYIYEYGQGGYATQDADAIGRSFLSDNDTEIVTLKDYRRRYEQYRSDIDLQILHASAPWICVWDDHEVTNDTWREGAENHNEGEGDFFERKAQALKAYFEWMPIRPVAEGDNEIIYRQFKFGNLVNLMMLDTRVIARDQQLSYTNYISADGSFNQAQFTADISDPNRTLLGFEQLNWLQNTMASSTATWQVLGQQVLMGRMNLPAELLLNLRPGADVLTLFSELATIKARILAGDPTITPQEEARVNTALPYNLDAWDGYFIERERVLGTAKSFNKNLVVLAGDTHNAWANNLTDLQGEAVGVEFATASVTSPGLEDFLSLPQEAWPATEHAFELLIDNLKYHNVGDRGYLLVTFTEEKTEAEWVYVDNILSNSFSLRDDRNKLINVKANENKLDI